MAHDLDGERTQLVILAIGQSLRRSDDDTLTRMDAQRVEVLHVADRDAVVVAVAHHLVLYLLPALEALLHQHLGREREGLLAEAGQLLLVVCEATTQSAQRIGCTDDDGVAELLSSLAGLLHVLASLALDGLDVDLVKLLDEELAVLRVHDGLHGRTQDAHTILLQHAALLQFHTTVECGLSTKGQEDAVGTFLLDNALDEIGLHGEEVDLVGHTLGGLHRGNIGVDEHRLDIFLAQGLEGLAAGVVKLAGLTNLQRAGTENQYLLYMLFYHDCFNVSTNLSNINSVSTGPEQASGWNCELNQGFSLWRIPSLEASFILTKSSSQSLSSVRASTA